MRSLAGWFGGHDICWRLPGGSDHEGVVFKDHLRICSRFSCSGLALKLGQIPGGFPSSEALDAIGDRCNHLSHAHESHHVERGD